MGLLDFLAQPSTADFRGALRNIPVRKGGILPLTEYGDGSARLDWTAGVPGSIMEAFTAPARAYRGEIAPDQMIPEGLNFAGTVALGSAGVPRPRASVGMGGKPAEVSSHLDMSPEARMARAREMGFDTKGYHWTGADFDEFKPHPYRGASFFGRTAEDAGRGATAGANDGTGTGSSKLREVMLPGGEVMGLALTPAERRWWSGLPERAGEEEITSILDQRPGDLSYGAKGMPWYQIYDEQRLPDGSFSYTKLPEPRLSWDEAAKSKYDVYGKQWPHYNPGSERFSSDYAKQHGMSGYTHQDEAGLAIGIVDPTRIRDVNAAFDPAKSSSANLLAANPETGAAPGLGLMAAAKQAEQPKGFTAYHGSPHDFDKFDMSKIGTGEGAQAYGHGLYFADSEGVARSYRDSLSHDGLGVVARGRLRQFGGDIDKTIEYLRGRVTGGSDAAAVNGRQALKELELAKAEEKTPGKLYQVRINADPEHFLDWDKPLSQQSEAVRKAYETALTSRGGPTIDKIGSSSFGSSGEAMQNLLSAWSKHDATSVSQSMRDAGIPGIKYLDQGSRAAGDGSRNYVVFDDKIIDILKKYGLLGAMGGGAAIASGSGDANARGILP